MFAGGLVSVSAGRARGEHVVGLITPRRDPQTPVLAALLDAAERLGRGAD